MYEKAKESYEKNGNLSITSYYVCEDGCKLGQWLASMKARYKKNIPNDKLLTEERVRKLEEIGVNFGKMVKKAKCGGVGRCDQK